MLKFGQQSVETFVQFISHQQLSAEDRSTRRGCSLDIESFYSLSWQVSIHSIWLLQRVLKKILLKRFSNEREKLFECLKFKKLPQKPQNTWATCVKAWTKQKWPHPSTAKGRLQQCCIFYRRNWWRNFCRQWNVSPISWWIVQTSSLSKHLH